MDNQCDEDGLPRVTTAILKGHTDEVWNMEWSHDGAFLASASKDKSVIIWRIGLNLSIPEKEQSVREYSIEHVLADHPYPVHHVAWSPDDSTLLTSTEHLIKLWITKTAACIRVLDIHRETITALAWLPDESGFISGSLDRRIIIWDTNGGMREIWPTTSTRITGLAISPDNSRLVAIGMQFPPPISADLNERTGTPLLANGPQWYESRMNIYDMATKEMQSSILFEGDLLNVQASQDSQYALVNHAPAEISLYDLNSGRLLRKFTGLQQGRHIIRSCVGGIDAKFVASGSEDGNVYIWHHDTGTLLEVLAGHGSGSVNSVGWNPRNEGMLASCSDDHTIRIWEASSPDMGWVLV